MIVQNWGAAYFWTNPHASKVAQKTQPPWCLVDESGLFLFCSWLVARCSFDGGIWKKSHCLLRLQLRILDETLMKPCES